MQSIPGLRTTYRVVTQGQAGGKTVSKGSTVTVHATGIVKETNKKFWSTKDPGHLQEKGHFLEVMHQEPQSQASIPFGIVVPGLPVINTAQSISPGRWTVPIPDAHKTRQLTVFLTQPIQDPSYGLTVYLSPPPYQEWIYLGAVSNNLPSNMFQVRWPVALAMQPFQAQLGAMLEPASEVVKKVSPVPPQEEEYRMFAKFIAEDLFRFMESFNKQTDARNELLLIPTKVLDMWYEKFSNKFKVDPFFWLHKKG